MVDKDQIKEHMEVADSNGRHIGTVDEIEDDRIKLTRSDSESGEHRLLMLDDVERLDGDRLVLRDDVEVPGSA